MPQVGFGDRNITELCQQYKTFGNETEIENADRNATAAAQIDQANVTTTQQERGLIWALINLRLIDFSKTFWDFLTLGRSRAFAAIHAFTEYNFLHPSIQVETIRRPWIC